MSRYIDADAIKLEKGFFEKVDNVPKFYKWLNKQPTVDAVPVVHSAWKHEIEDMGIFRQHTVRCLNCKCGFTHAYVVLLCGDTGDLFMHCPNCGAIMDGADGERRTE